MRAMTEEPSQPKAFLTLLDEQGNQVPLQEVREEPGQNWFYAELPLPLPVPKLLAEPPQSHHDFFVAKCVTRSFLTDFWCKLLNLAGGNLGPYERMAKKACEQCWAELALKDLEPEWYRYETTFTTRGELFMSLYGQSKARSEEV